MKKPKVAIITNIITTYRKGFYDRLFSIDDIHVEVFCQDFMPGMNLNSIHKDYPQNVHIIKYNSAKKEKIVWQYIPWLKILKSFDVVFVAGNPRVITDVLFGTFCRIINKKVVLWTMAHSFRGNRITENIRLVWTKIFPIIFVYTDKEVDFLKNKGFKSSYILGMNNGLDQKKIDKAIDNITNNDLENWKINNKFDNRAIIISCARLEKKNNFKLLLKALPQVIKEIPDLLWLVIGAGEEEDFLKSEVQNMELTNHVSFLGQIYEESKLTPYFLTASVFVHPSSIGLSLLHAFGYGLPVIVHGVEELHGPEFTAFINGETGLVFEKDNQNDLSSKIINLLKSPDRIREMGINAQFIARNTYNVDVMVERFIHITNYALKK
jgi:glycosyltransferase involved in cell wall biosynthesis